jgi:hypothetical protein
VHFTAAPGRFKAHQSPRPGSLCHLRNNGRSHGPKPLLWPALRTLEACAVALCSACLWGVRVLVYCRCSTQALQCDANLETSKSLSWWALPTYPDGDKADYQPYSARPPHPMSSSLNDHADTNNFMCVQSKLV